MLHSTLLIIINVILSESKEPLWQLRIQAFQGLLDSNTIQNDGLAYLNGSLIEIVLYNVSLRYYVQTFLITQPGTHPTLASPPQGGER
ncbi:MAG: hypothetical protein AB1847_21100 [bacterium]